MAQQLVFLVITVWNIVTLLFLMRFCLTESFFFFNPVLTPVYRFTQPAIAPFRKVLGPIGQYDPAPLAVALLLLLLQGPVLAPFFGGGYGLVTVRLLDNSLDFFGATALIMAFCTLFVYSGTNNPFGVFCYAMLSPIRRPLGLLTRNRWTISVGSMIVILAGHFMLQLLLAKTAELAGVFVMPQFAAFSHDLRRQFVNTVALFLSVSRAVQGMLIIRILLSWFPQAGSNAILDFLFMVVDPILRPFRRIIPPIAGIDFSPILLFLLISWLERMLAVFLRPMA